MGLFSDSLSGIGSILSGVAGIGSAVGGFQGAGFSNKWAQKNFDFQKEQYEYQKQLQQSIFDREDNAVQRRVADLQNAGLSATLAAGSAAGAGAPVKTEAPQMDISANDRRARAFSEIASVPLQILGTEFDVASRLNAIQQQEEQIATSKAQRDLIMAQQLKTAADTDVAQASLALFPSRQDLLSSQVLKNVAQRGQVSANTAAILQATGINNYNYQLSQALNSRTTEQLTPYSLAAGAARGLGDLFKSPENANSMVKTHGADFINKLVHSKPTRDAFSHIRRSREWRD
ncbi:DNA pilot protein [Flyfo microvirus Tbat2_163]|nr:DNA pilot protein [Flyfo microvirus Tbat2_163]